MGRRKKPSPEKEEPEVVALLRAQLEASELRHRVNELQSVVSSLEAELKESNSLLLKSRNIKRPFTNSVEKQLIAARQNWRCASGDACPLRTLTPNQTFDSSLFIIDHRIPFSRCGKHVNMRQALCVHCDSVKTRTELATRQHRRPDPTSDTDGEEEEEADEPNP